MFSWALLTRHTLPECDNDNEDLSYCYCSGLRGSKRGSLSRLFPFPFLSLYLVAMERAGLSHLSCPGPPPMAAPLRPHGPVAGKAATSALRGRTGACDPDRATRPVAPATPHTAAIPFCPPPNGGQQTAGRRTQRRDSIRQEEHLHSTGRALWQRPLPPWQGSRRLGGTARGRVALMGTTQ